MADKIDKQGAWIDFAHDAMTQIERIDRKLFNGRGCLIRRRVRDRSPTCGTVESSRYARGRCINPLVKGPRLARFIQSQESRRGPGPGVFARDRLHLESHRGRSRSGRLRPIPAGLPFQNLRFLFYDSFVMRYVVLARHLIKNSKSRRRDIGVSVPVRKHSGKTVVRVLIPFRPIFCPI